MWNELNYNVIINIMTKKMLKRKLAGSVQTDMMSHPCLEPNIDPVLPDRSSTVFSTTLVPLHRSETFECSNEKLKPVSFK